MVKVLNSQNTGIEIWMVESINSAILAGENIDVHLQIRIEEDLI